MSMIAIALLATGMQVGSSTATSSAPSSAPSSTTSSSTTSSRTSPSVPVPSARDSVPTNAPRTLDANDNRTSTRADQAATDQQEDASTPRRIDVPGGGRLSPRNQDGGGSRINTRQQ